MRSVGVDIPSREGSIFCPFHENVDTPAAKLFRDPEGDRIWCFQESKMYRPFDVFYKKLTKDDPNVIFRRIWAQLNETQRENIINTAGVQVNYLPENWEEVSVKLDFYKSGSLSYIEGLKEVLKLIGG